MNISLITVGLILICFIILLLDQILYRKVSVEWDGDWESWKKKLPGEIRVPRWLKDESVPGWIQTKYGVDVKRWYDL